MDITKEQFENVYNKHLPNKFIIYMFKFFAKDTEKTSGVKIKSDRVAWAIMFPLFCLGLLFTIINLPKLIIGIVTALLSLVLGTVVIGGFIAGFWNNIRIRKIAKELGLDLVQYNKLVDSLF